ncbi:MAG: YceI family protein [Pseudomonadota bacterium]
MKRFSLAALAAFALAGALATAPIAATPAIAAETYAIDVKGAHASINFRVKHLGYSWLTGRFDNFDGSFTFDKNNPAASKINVVIETASVNSNHAARDKHLRSADFLNVAAHPKATFESTAIKVTGEDTAIITGNFTFLGVTKPVEIEAKYIGGGKDPWGGFRQGFAGTTSFKMADFGMVKSLGPQSAVVELDLHVEGIRQ